MLTSMKGHYAWPEYLKISTLAKLALVGLVYVYAVKLIDTLYRGIFSPSAVAVTVVALNILAGLIQITFFVELYRQFVPKDNQVLIGAAWLSATLLCVFCIIFLIKYRFNKIRSLKYAFTFGAFGWLIMASAQFLVLVNYLTAGRWNGLANLCNGGPHLFVIASSLTLLSLCFFYYKFAVITEVRR